MTNATNILIEDLTLVPVPVWWQSPWFIALVALALGALAWAVARWWHRRPAAAATPAPPPVGPPPHLEALRRLADLRRRHEQLDAYGVAIECSDILRTYIEARFDLPIRYQTTREFLGAAQQSPALAADIRSQLGEFLQFFDPLKFARAAAAPAQTLAILDRSEQLIRSCIPAGANGGRS